jgi:putative flippase GtrA
MVLTLHAASKKIINRETINFGLWGIATSIWNIGLFQLLYYFQFDYRIANIVALVTSKALAYLTNKRFVFRTHCETRKALLQEIFRFIVARGFTMLIDFFGLILLTYIMSPKIGKLLTTSVVVILNYILGKYHVYRASTGR